MDTNVIVKHNPFDPVIKQYIGQWNRLVSLTNWEKGRIICQWRDAMKVASLPPREFSDEAWSKRVSNVSSQHVGRLRRVFERFGQSYPGYPGLYWSHFLSAVDWDDASVWLQGAIEGSWSVSMMRKKRWEALGSPVEETPREDEIVVSEFDEDSVQPSAEDISPENDGDDDFGERLSSDVASWEDNSGVDIGDQDDAMITQSVATVRPFEELPELPEDLADAFEQFKLAILRHKLEGWQQIATDDLLATLDSLKNLVLAPSE